MTPMNPTEKKQQLKIEAELRQLALEHEKMAQQVREKNAELIESNKLLQAEVLERKKVEAEILDATQAEQRRFGSQLHDGLCQELAAILVFAKALAQKMEKNKTLELAELKKISTMLLSAVDQARDTARGLYPGELKGTSLMFSLEELTRNIQNLSGVMCSFTCPSSVLVDDNNIATHLYRIAQEGINNAVKHGKATHIELSFTQQQNHITLIIKDDGIGIADDAKNAKGIGLKIMRYRARMINATFSMKPNSPQGVILECTLNKPNAQGSPS